MNSNIYCQMFSANGQFVGNNFRVNEIIGTASSPAIAVRKDGSFLICWKDFGVKVRLFDNKGIPKSSSHYINDTLFNRVDNSLKVGCDEFGRFVVVWDEYVVGNIIPNIFFQRLDTLGNKIGDNKKVNDDGLNIKHENPLIIVNTNGSFNITWNDTRPPSVANKDDIYFQMFDGSGVKVGVNQRVNDDISQDNLQHHPKISTDSLGKFVIAWNDDRNSHNNNEVYAQRFSESGIRIGQNFRVTQSSLSITKGLSSIDENLMEIL